MRGFGRRAWLIGAWLFVAGCAHLGLGSGQGARERLWREAHWALEAGEFARADTLFATLGREHARSREGRESWFFRGAMRLDPRNPAWDPEPSERYLAEYLAVDSLPRGVSRRPEGEVLLALARELNLPPKERIEELQPEETVRTRVQTRVETRVVTRRVVVRAERSEAEQAELRRRLRASEAEAARLKAELERIRRTLTTPGRQRSGS